MLFSAQCRHHYLRKQKNKVIRVRLKKTQTNRIKQNLNFNIVQGLREHYWLRCNHEYKIFPTVRNCFKLYEKTWKKKKYHWPFQTPAADAWSHGGKWRLCSCPSFLWASIHSSWCKQCTKPVLRYHHICLQNWSKAVKKCSWYWHIQKAHMNLQVLRFSSKPFDFTWILLLLHL